MLERNLMSDGALADPEVEEFDADAGCADKSQLLGTETTSAGFDQISRRTSERK